MRGVKLIEWAKSKRISLAGYIFERSNIGTRKEMLQLLVKHGLNTLIKNRRNQNLLHEFAAWFVEKDDHDAAEIAEILVKSGIPVDAEDEFGLTSIHYCNKKAPNYDFVSFLINHGDVNIITEQVDVSILLLVQNNVDLLRFLVSKGADVNAVGKSGFTVLHNEALHYNREEVMRFLIQQGSNVSTQDYKGRTPFSFLDPHRKLFTKCRILMLKEFAKRKYQKKQILETDKKLIKADIDSKIIFEKCVNELKNMSSTVFYPSYTYYYVLNIKKNTRRIEEFKKCKRDKKIAGIFKEGLQKFYYYRDDVERIFNEFDLV